MGQWSIITTEKWQAQHCCLCLWSREGRLWGHYLRTTQENEVLLLFMLTTCRIFCTREKHWVRHECTLLTNSYQHSTCCSQGSIFLFFDKEAGHILRAEDGVAQIKLWLLCLCIWSGCGLVLVPYLCFISKECKHHKQALPAECDLKVLLRVKCWPQRHYKNYFLKNKWCDACIFVHLLTKTFCCHRRVRSRPVFPLTEVNYWWVISSFNSLCFHKIWLLRLQEEEGWAVVLIRAFSLLSMLMDQTEYK